MRIRFPLFASFILSGMVMFVSCEGTTVVDEQPEIEISDKDSTEIEIPVDPEPEPADPPTVDIAVYQEYPEEIDGCACYFGRTASELSDAKYVFMTNYEKKAYMELDGEMRVFELVSSTDSEQGELIEKWLNEDYDMTVKTTEVGQLDETWQSIGTIRIKPKDKAPTEIKVVGECGC